MSIYPPNTTTPKPGSNNYLWNWLGSPLKKFAAALSPYMGGDVGYKKYVALLTQSGTDAPVATVLENTLETDVVWTRSGVGNYIGTSTAFVVGKTVCPQFPALGFETNATFTPISANANPQIGWINAYLDSTGNFIEIDTYDMTSYEEWSIILGSSLFIEIRVYP